MIITLAFSVGFNPRDERVKNSQFANGLLDAPPCGGTTNLLKTVVGRLRREFTVEFEVLSVIGWRVSPDLENLYLQRVRNTGWPRSYTRILIA